MTKMLSLLTLAHQFLTERDWWQFHNPKNDAMNMLVEASELAECFIAQDTVTETTQTGVADEIADVLFASLLFAAVNARDIARSIGSVIGDATLYDEHTSYEQLRDLVLQHSEQFGLSQLSTPRQVTLSLLVEIGKVSDIFVWCSEEASRSRAQAKQDFIEIQLAKIMAHILFLASITNVDLVEEYTRKMKINAENYPVQDASGEKYAALKEQRRMRKL